MVSTQQEITQLIAEIEGGGRETLEEKLHSFHHSCFMFNKEEEKSLKDFFRKEFIYEKFMSDDQIEEFPEISFTFAPSYCYYDAAFGEEFREFIKELIPRLKEQNRIILEQMSKEDEKSGSLDIGKMKCGGVTQEMMYWYHSAEEHEELIRELQQGGMREVDVKVNYGRSDIKSVECIVSAGEKLLFGYFITPKSEAEKEVRLPEGFEQRTYKIKGKGEQLDEIEGLFNYFKRLGSEGHTTSVALHYEGNVGLEFERISEELKILGKSMCYQHETREIQYLVEAEFFVCENGAEDEERVYKIIGKTGQLDKLEGLFWYLNDCKYRHAAHAVVGYDGDGSVRMVFRRADGRILQEPVNQLALYTEVDDDLESRKDLTPEQYLELLRQHRAFSWEEDGKEVHLYTDFSDVEIPSQVEVDFGIGYEDDSEF